MDIKVNKLNKAIFKIHVFTSNQKIKLSSNFNVKITNIIYLKNIIDTIEFIRIDKKIVTIHAFYLNEDAVKIKVRCSQAYNINDACVAHSIKGYCKCFNLVKLNFKIN